MRYFCESPGMALPCLSYQVSESVSSAIEPFEAFRILILVTTSSPTTFVSGLRISI